MARTAKKDIESRWYDVFSAWGKEDRAIALRVLATLHEHLPDDPAKKAGPVQPELPGASA
jgi:hypothetical protein